nr:hypothetical protein CFP56_19317 [Quercus suber]
MVCLESEDHLESGLMITSKITDFRISDANSDRDVRRPILGLVELLLPQASQFYLAPDVTLVAWSCNNQGCVLVIFAEQQYHDQVQP